MTVATASLVLARAAWGHGRKWHAAEANQEGIRTSLCGIPVVTGPNDPFEIRPSTCARCATVVDLRGGDT